MTIPSKVLFLRIWRTIKIGTMIIVPILLLCLPANFFDNSSIKFSVFEWLGMEGHYSQGLTRASMHLIHLDFAGASSYNRLAFVVVPLLAGVYALSLYREIKRYRSAYFQGSPQS